MSSYSSSSRRSRRPPSLNLSFTSSREGSPTYSNNSSPEPESDEDTRSHVRSRDRRTDTQPSSRPFSMSSIGSYCLRRPTLKEVLSNTAPAPYTLSAFMAYLSQNHCLETLEFTMDAGRYRKHYNAVMKPDGAPASPDGDGRAYVRMLWNKLLDAYIVPNGPREVNLPCHVRDDILSIPNTHTPPPPEALDETVQIVYDLMQESVLIPFLNEYASVNQYNCGSSSEYCQPWDTTSPEDNVYMRGSLDERLLQRKREPSPPVPLDFVSHSYSPRTRENRSVSPFSASLGWGSSSSSSRHAPSSSWTSAGSGDSLTEDSGTSTPSYGTPMTPPTTPPTSEAFLAGSHGGSPKGVGRGMADKAEKSWKRMTGGLGGFGRGFGLTGKKRDSGMF